MAIIEFLEEYSKSGFARFHMPGHKGKIQCTDSILKCEYDITEINNADFLYNSSGIIQKSEEKASELYGTKETLFSAGGSTLCIGTMLRAVSMLPQNISRFEKKIIASRNVHSSFVNFCSLLNLEPVWVYPEYNQLTGLCGQTTPESILEALDNAAEKNFLSDICGVYITSPDYFGQMADISKISIVCKQYALPLIVDNAHGAHLKFLSESLHPMDCGVDLCCDSLHKTLPALTGAGLLHVNKDSQFGFERRNLKSDMAVFGSTSPSYLILASIERCIELLENSGCKSFCELCETRGKLCGEIEQIGISVLEDTDITKISLDCFSVGVTGDCLARHLRANKIEPEYVSERYIVLIISPFNTFEDYAGLLRALDTADKKKLPLNKTKKNKAFVFPKVKITPGEAFEKEYEYLPLQNAEGRISAQMVSVCPPGVPILIPGEYIDGDVIVDLAEHGIDEIKAIKL